MSKKKEKQQSQPGEAPLESPDTISGDGAAVEQQIAEERRRLGYALLQEGARLLSQRRPGEAAEKLERAAEYLPDSAEVAINLGGTYVLQKRYSKAVPLLEKASKLAPDDAMLWSNLAAAYLGRLEISGPKQQKKAIEAYERALEINPRTPNVHYNLGLVYKDQKEWESARSAFLNALEVYPNDNDAQYWLGKLDDYEQQERRSGKNESTLSDQDREDYD
ncbi:MAG: tetratricopeptide repeat protein [Chloroflexota bacterium]|nr:tetratricopeptide repeat protein [Chloroflexota bacterium]